MTLDIPRTIDVLQTSILRELGDEVELIFRYGSQLKGATHAYSDLDISYVPAHESTWNSITVLVDGVMIDFYPIHWSRLEQMANFDDISGTVLLENQIVYQRDEDVASRFQALPVRLRSLMQTEARPAMLRKAIGIFQNTGYPYYLLRQQAANSHLLSCLHHARQILRIVVHSLVVCNQMCIDSRKLAQVLALPKLPAGFGGMVDRVTKAVTPNETLSACEDLLNTTRALLLDEQRQVLCHEMTFPDVFDSGYPELKGTLQHLMLACERRDLYNFNLMELYHELMFHMTLALTGVEYSAFNSLAEYEQDLVALGFPDLLPYVVAGDLDGLHEQCKAFDQHMQKFLTERSVPLNVFGSVDALERYLKDSMR